MQCKRGIFTGGKSMENIDCFRAGDRGVMCDLEFEPCTIDDVVIWRSE